MRAARESRGATSGTVWSIPLTGGVSTDAGFKTYMQTRLRAVRQSGLRPSRTQPARPASRRSGRRSPGPQRRRPTPRCSSRSPASNSSVRTVQLRRSRRHRGEPSSPPRPSALAAVLQLPVTSSTRRSWRPPTARSDSDAERRHRFASTTSTAAVPWPRSPPRRRRSAPIRPAIQPPGPPA